MKHPYPALRPESFTLIEVIVALAILTVSLAGMLQLSISSQRKVAAAAEKWQAEHMLAQAAEYLMLMNDEDTTVTEEFFPYPGYSVEVVCDDAAELPEDYNNLVGQLPLKCWNISVIRNSDGKTVAAVNIDRISYEEESE